MSAVEGPTFKTQYQLTVYDPATGLLIERLITGDRGLTERRMKFHLKKWAKNPTTPRPFSSSRVVTTTFSEWEKIDDTEATK
jgi:hypothetical protein